MLAEMRGAFFLFRVPRLLPDYYRSACIGNHHESRPVEWTVKPAS